MSLRRGAARVAGLVLTVGLLSAAVAAVLSHGAEIDGRLDLFAHFAPAYMAMAFAGLMVAAVARLPGRPLIVVAGVVGAMASGLLIAPEFMRPTTADGPFDETRQIKVIQINALRTNADIGRVADWLIAQDPDVVTVSEARHDLRDLLIERAGWSAAGAQGSLMIFTHEPYLKMDRPRPRAGGQLTYVNATYVIHDELVEIATAHLDWPTETIAAGQARDLEDVVRRLPRERLILTGDFNATPWSNQLRRLDETLGLIRRDRAVASWPAQLSGRRWAYPLLPIDHVYAGRGWATIRVERGPWLGSDHYPVIVTLAPISRR